LADIFISYSREDRDRVTALAAALESEGYSLWWDHNLSAGGRFVTEIEEQLEAARVVLVVWSESSINSMWVADEANVGLERNILVPVAIDGVRPKLGFRQIQTIDLSKWNDSALPESFDLLKAAISARLQMMPAPKFEAPVQHLADKPWILMEPLSAPAGDEDLNELAVALSEEIESALSRFPHLLVASREHQDPRLSARYEILGSLRRGGSRLRLTMQLRNRAKGNQVWGSKFDRVAEDVLDLDLQDDLVDHVVAAIADPYGALVRDLCADVDHKSLESQTAYELTLRQFIYKQRIDADEHRVLRDAARLAVEKAPNDSNAWAILAHASIEEYKHEFNHEPGARARALEAARKAVDLGRNNAYAHFQLAEVQYFRQDLGAFRAGAERAFELNTRDSESLAMIGILLGYAGDWDRGVEMTTRAMDLNPDHPGWYRFCSFFYHYLRGDDEKALEIAERVNMPSYFADPYVRCIAHAQLGHEKAAREALEEFLTAFPDARTKFREQHFNRWNFAQPELVERVSESFARVGLEFD
jgi:TolB-like protein